MNQKYVSLTLILLLIVVACKKEDPVNINNNIYKEGGLFIINEGNYSSSNSSVCYYAPETDTVFKDIFYKTNDVPLGDIAQSISFRGDLAYITVNNSGIVYSVRASNMQFKGSVSGLVSPRKTLIINKNKAYVTDFSSKSITVFDPANMEITGQIHLGRTSEDIIKWNNKVYVSNWSGYNQSKTNNMIMVIDSDNDAVADSIVVGLEPQSMIIDRNDNLWVLCSGGYSFEENPSLWCIKTTDNSVIKTIIFENIQTSPEELKINKNGDSLFFLNGDVYSMTVTSETIPVDPIIKSEIRNLYSLAVSDNGDIYVGDAMDYARNGVVYRYKGNGTLISSFQTGIIPGDMVFWN